MEFRNLGHTGLRVSVVGLGCNNFGGRLDLAGTRAVIDRAIDSGITLFDTAESYGNGGGSERLMGECLGARRKDIVLATKFGWSTEQGATAMGSRRYAMQAVEASLQRLKTDWIDLYQFHKPDPRTPLDETLRAMDDIVRQGKARYVGISNHPAWQVVDAQWITRHNGLAPLASCQDQYNLLVRDAEKDLIPAMQAQGMSLLPYFPLASGLLTGKYEKDKPAPAGTRFAGGGNYTNRYLTESNWKKIDALTAFAAERGHTLLDVAFSWLARKPAVASVIAGATKPEQVEANIKAASWALSAEEMKQIDALSA
jgi:aryl-alcohol dehydrogenase-like predicted oxidoreductase